MRRSKQTPIDFEVELRDLIIKYLDRDGDYDNILAELKLAREELERRVS